MARATLKTKNRAGENYRCCSCSSPIVAGEQYYQWSFFRERTPTRRHASHGHPRPSMLCNGKMSQAMAACEALEDDMAQMDNPTDINDALQTCIDELRSVADEYEEAINNMPASEEQNRERIDQLESLICELESAQSECDNAELHDLESLDENVSDEERERLEGENENAMQELQSTVDSALSGREF